MLPDPPLGRSRRRCAALRHLRAALPRRPRWRVGWPSPWLNHRRQHFADGQAPTTSTWPNQCEWSARAGANGRLGQSTPPVGQPRTHQYRQAQIRQGDPWRAPGRKPVPRSRDGRTQNPPSPKQLVKSKGPPKRALRPAARGNWGNAKKTSHGQPVHKSALPGCAAPAELSGAGDEGEGSARPAFARPPGPLLSRGSAL